MNMPEVEIDTQLRAWMEGTVSGRGHNGDRVWSLTGLEELRYWGDLEALHSWSQHSVFPQASKVG